MTRFARRIALALAATAAVLWLFGAILSDRFAWSQWLAWIPTPLVALACAGAALTARRRRRTALAFAALACALAGLSMFVENRPFAGAPDSPADLRLVHWTVAESLDDDDKAHVMDVATHAGADLVILTNAGHMASSPAVTAWRGDGPPPLLSAPFRVLSRRPVRALRPLVAADGIRVALLVLDAPETPNGTIEILLVDLPSDPRRGRMAIADQVARLLAATDTVEPDLVVGDCNMTRGSAALRRLFPEHRSAWHDAGRGRGASFPRAFPVYHIDHVLLGPGVTCTDYTLPDGGVGRHRLQVAALRFSR